MTDTVNVPREAVERFKDALENMPDVLERHTKGQKFNAYDLDDDGGSRAVCIGPITSRPLSLFTAPADVAELVEASLKLAANALAAAPKAEPVSDPDGESVAQRMASDTALKVAKDIHVALEKLIYGLPDYLASENLTDEENMIRDAQIALDVTAHRLANIELAQPEAPKVEQEPVAWRYRVKERDGRMGGWRLAFNPKPVGANLEAQPLYAHPDPKIAVAVKALERIITDAVDDKLFNDEVTHLIFKTASKALAQIKGGA